MNNDEYTSLLYDAKRELESAKLKLDAAHKESTNRQIISSRNPLRHKGQYTTNPEINPLLKEIRNVAYELIDRASLTIVANINILK